MGADAGLSKLNSMLELSVRGPPAPPSSAGAVRRAAFQPGSVDMLGPTPSIRIGAHEVLPRKEVIQPQLPLRLPCYDFTPVTSPTFDGSLPCGLGHRLRVLLTPVV